MVGSSVVVMLCYIDSTKSYRRLLRLDFIFVVRQTLIFLCEVPDKGMGGQTDFYEWNETYRK